MGLIRITYGCCYFIILRSMHAFIMIKDLGTYVNTEWLEPFSKGLTSCPSATQGSKLTF